MRIVLTGSRGLIGTALTARLHEGGHTVVGLSRGADHGLRWDPAAGQLDPAVLDGVDGVVNLAGEPIAARRWSDEQKRRIRDSRVKGTTLLAETMAAMASPPPVFVSASAIGYYGDRADEVLTETSPAGSGFLADLCLAWEAAAIPAAAAGIRVTSVRTGIVLDREGGALAKQLPLFRFGLGGKLGSGRQWWSWISLADEVDAIIHLLHADVRGPVNLTAPEPVTNQTFTKALGQAMHRPTFLTVPSFGPKLLLGTELADQLLFASAKVMPNVLVESGFHFHHPTLSSAMAAVLA